jgi:hypothetical protein
MRMIHEKIYAKNLVCIFFYIDNTRLFGEQSGGNKILGLHGKKSFFIIYIIFKKKDKHFLYLYFVNIKILFILITLYLLFND